MNVLNTIVKNSPHLSWIKDRTIFLTIHGSRAYNTHTPESDHDWRGIAIPTQEYLYGFSKNFEQAILQAPNPDTCVFGLKKFFQLASQCNPNCIEILYTDPSSHSIVTKLGQKLIDNRDLFLSKRIKHTTSGYAYGQMSKIRLHRQYLIQPMKGPPNRKDWGLPDQPVIAKAQYEAASADIQKYLDKSNFDFLDDYNAPQKIEIKNAYHDMLVDLKITLDDQWVSAARGVGLHDNFIEIMKKERAFRNAEETWKKYLFWKKTRNPTRYALEEKYGLDTKHAMHLVRILRMCREVLTTGELIVKRPDREELLAIRNGAWSFEKLDEFFTREEEDLKKVYLESKLLPHHPDLKKIDDLYMNIVSESFI